MIIRVFFGKSSGSPVHFAVQGRIASYTVVPVKQACLFNERKRNGKMRKYFGKKQVVLQSLSGLGVILLLSMMQGDFASASSVKYMRVGSEYKVTDKAGIVKLIDNEEDVYVTKSGGTPAIVYPISQRGKHVITYINKKKKKRKVIIYADGKRPEITLANVEKGTQVTVKDNYKLGKVYLDGKKQKSKFIVTVPGEHTVLAIDKAGNKKKLLFKVSIGTTVTTAPNQPASQNVPVTTPAQTALQSAATTFFTSQPTASNSPTVVPTPEASNFVEASNTPSGQPSLAPSIEPTLQPSATPVITTAIPRKVMGILRVSEDGKVVLGIENKAVATTVMIPSGVKKISNSAFYNCNHLERIVLPDTLTTIGDYAFYNCSLISQMTIPDAVTSIGASAFAHCSSLSSIRIPRSVTGIGEYAFTDCYMTKENINNESNLELDGLTIVSTDENGYCIDRNTFYRYRKAEGASMVRVTAGVTKVGSYAFYDCDHLDGIVIPAGVTSIGRSAFENCSGLTKVTLPNSVTSIEYGAFSGCSSLTDIRLPDGITEISKYAFFGCSGLQKITVPEKVTNIAKYAFYGCSSLTSVTLPDDLDTIEERAFSGCSSLNSFTIPKKISSIEEYAFCDCASLANIKVPKYVSGVGEMAFYGIDNVNFAGKLDGAPWGAKALNGQLQ